MIHNMIFSDLFRQSALVRNRNFFLHTSPKCEPMALATGAREPGGAPARSVASAVGSTEQRSSVSKQSLLIAVLFSLLSGTISIASDEVGRSIQAADEADVCVYGGTSGGVVAAVQAARLG
jgi:hypothetical protein